MIRTFVETPIFTKNWFSLGLNDDNLKNLQTELLLNPKTGDPIPGVPGLRKTRIAYKGHGKRGGARVIYVDVEIKEKIYLINVYSKDSQEDLTFQEKKELNKHIGYLKGE